MNDGQNKKHLLILIGIGVAVVIFLVIAFSQKPTPRPQPGPQPGGGSATNDLPKELRVVSGRITDISGSSMTIEWSVPQKPDFSEVKIFPKHITWRDNTIFSRVRADVPSAKPETIKPADLKVGQTVVVSTLETIQDHFELTALSIQVQVPPTPKQP